MAESRRRRFPGGTALALVLVTTGAWAVAKINLEFQAVPEPCATRTLGVSLYAVSDNQGNQSLSAMDVILQWDPEVLELRGIDNSGPYPYPWLFSGFTNDHGLDGLNDTWADGNALYTALAQLGGPPAYATPQGLLVTTFLFRKLEVGSPTLFEILPDYGLYTHTVVYDGVVPGLNVTGTLGNIMLTPGPRGDMNCDGAINAFDIDPFVLALTDPVGYAAAYPNCDRNRADINCDNAINAFDIDPFVVLLTS